MPTTAEAIRAAVEERFAQVAGQPKQETKFPVGPISAKRLGYDAQEEGEDFPVGEDCPLPEGQAGQ